MFAESLLDNIYHMKVTWLILPSVVRNGHKEIPHPLNLSFILEAVKNTVY